MVRATVRSDYSTSIAASSLETGIGPRVASEVFFRQGKPSRAARDRFRPRQPRFSRLLLSHACIRPCLCIRDGQSYARSLENEPFNRGRRLNSSFLVKFFRLSCHILVCSFRNGHPVERLTSLSVLRFRRVPNKIGVSFNALPTGVLLIEFSVVVLYQKEALTFPFTL